MQRPQVVVIDTGGQYAHLIARKIRECGVYSEIINSEDSFQYDWTGARSIVISGGPASVYDQDRPDLPDSILKLGIPVLGICYGMQWIVKTLGGIVTKASRGEYGSSILTVANHNKLFEGTPVSQQVWSSHRDQVVAVSGFSVIGSTSACPMAAIMSDPDLLGDHLYGVQFHPEVAHSPYGKQILGNFVLKICECQPDWDSSCRRQILESNIKGAVGDRNVLFFVSGGVDSAVAYKLTKNTLGPERVNGYFVDTGLMRSDDAELIHDVDPDIKILDASKQFLGALFGVTEPEEKRNIIGELFLDVIDEFLESDKNTVLGQGTIYPDTIESGNTKNSDRIKTHHNRVNGIQTLMREGRVVEPLSLLYKDEVRQIGRELRMPNKLLDRHPFPGPGLAIRCLCNPWNAQLSKLAGGWMIPVRSVGVQGDNRTYRHIYAVEHDWFERDAALSLIETSQLVNRVISLESNMSRLTDMGVWTSGITPDRIEKLRKVDTIVRKVCDETGFSHQIWQMPVVLMPVGTISSPDSIVLRPINSVDGMTASPVEIPEDLLRKLVDLIMGIGGIAGVFVDHTPKPPATIEYE